MCLKFGNSLLIRQARAPCLRARARARAKHPSNCQFVPGRPGPFRPFVRQPACAAVLRCTWANALNFPVTRLRQQCVQVCVRSMRSGPKGARAPQSYRAARRTSCASCSTVNKHHLAANAQTHTRTRTHARSNLIRQSTVWANDRQRQRHARKSRHFLINTFKIQIIRH